MKNDPLIDEIRQTRHEISAEFNHDTKKMVAYYQQVEKELRASNQYSFFEDQIAPFPPKLIGVQDFS
jgi:hypothetical protein